MQPLAERLRPRTLDEYIGQKHLVGPGAVLRKMIDAGRISSFILWGPPGVGKTTLAQIIANKLETPFYTLSAVTSGVKDVRDVIERAKSNRFFLGAVEQGTVTLIGATTENPSFEVIRPLLSRCQLYTLKSLEKDDLLELLQRAITTDTVLKERKIELKETTAMLRFSGGDARKLLNILELVIDSEATDPVLITDDMVTERLQQNPLAYDKDGAAACQRLLRHADESGMARRTYPPGRSHHIPRHQSQEQFSLYGHQQCPGTGTRNGQPPRPPAPTQCAHQADEAVGLRREV